ncbi:hypothetical protein [Streptomyces sp. NBC_01716]|uniref:hypothetical protein n=1 Tax=Streptomyces sp. NBC_01716 TaxID=2975917 RepID=UPI002E2FD303|nr:hypothetical protein [Streptomyces sp. NBC_01716]
MRESTDVPAWPVYDLTVHDDGRILTSGPLIPLSGHATRAAAIEVVAGAAARLGRAVRATATEPGGAVWQLIVSPEGEVSEVPGGGARTTAPKKRKGRRPVARSAEAADVPAASGPRPGAPKGAETYAESLAQVREHLDAGRTDQAGELAARLDAQAAGVLGVSHPEALRIREVHARATALAGDVVGGVQLYRDVAERWHYRGDAEQAETAAGHAEMLWMRMTHVGQALSAGVDVIRMRNQIPGRSGEALAAALEHREWLLKAQDAGEPGAREQSVADTPAPRVVADPPAPRAPRPAPTWERPAVDTRKAG